MLMQAAAGYARRTDMRWAAVSAAIVAAAVDFLYLGIVGSQGSNPQFLRVPFVAAFIALMAICAALSSLAPSVRWRSLLLGFSATGLLLIGFLAIFSIGLPLLFAGLLALGGLIGTLNVAESREASSKAAALGMAAGGAVVAAAVLLAGFSLTELAIRCPAHVIEGGSGVNFLSGPYQFSCDNGKLTISH